MNIQRKNSAYHFRMQSERKQTLVLPCRHIPQKVHFDVEMAVMLQRKFNHLPIADGLEKTVVPSGFD